MRILLVALVALFVFGCASVPRAQTPPEPVLVPDDAPGLETLGAGIKIRDMTTKATPSTGAMFPMVEPSPDTTAYKATLSAILSGAVLDTGDTMTGDLALSGTAKITMAGGVYAPVTNGGPITALTTGSTKISGTNEGLRKSMFSLFSTNPTDEDSVALMVDQVQTSHAGSIARTGIHCKSFTEPDVGGDTSCILGVSTGGGTAATFYVRPEKRPAGYADYSTTSTQPALEVGTSAARVPGAGPALS